MHRPDHDELYMTMAFLVATRSTCKRGQVGAIVVKDKRPVSIGYNGSPPGQPHCLDVGCEPEDGCERTIHDVSNAIAWAARHGVAIEGATIFSTHSPCRSCANLALAAGITRFVYCKEYRLGRTDILTAAGIKVDKYERHWIHLI